MNEPVIDRRVRKTKKILRECLTQLLKSKKIQDITVRELTEMADLNRGTFYLHYKDVFDLLEQMEDELLISFSQLLNQLDATNRGVPPRQVLAEIFSMARENADLAEILLGENGDLNFLNRLKALIREKCLRDWMALVRGGSGADFEACCAFISSGSVGLVHHWLQTGMAQSPQELAVLAERIILHGMSALKEGEYR